ncbi:hypothetical protein ABPG72_012433 [Tetrahymena utriculariae]
MNDFFKNLRKKAHDYKKNNQHDLNKVKNVSYYFYQEVMKKGESINQKIRMEKIYIQSRYGDQIKNQNLNTFHTKWLSFRDKYLATYASKALYKLKEFGPTTQRLIQNPTIQNKLYGLQQKMQEKGINSSKVNQVTQNGYQLIKKQLSRASVLFSQQNLNKFIYSPLNYCSQYVLKNRSKAFKGLLLLVFCYGLGSYIPVAIKDYYLQKQYISQYSQLQMQQNQLQMEQQKLQNLLNKINQTNLENQQP